MYIITVHYPWSEGAKFDFDYYRETHLPMVGKAFGPFGLGYASVLRGENQPDGSPPAFIVTAVLSFREEKGARDALASEDAKAVLADIPKFTDITPVIQFNTAVP